MTQDAASVTPVRPTPKMATELPPGLWSTSITIRLGRCDVAGIVYTPQYFDIFNEVMEAWYIERLGINYYDVHKERGIGLGYGHASCEFFAPSRMGETLAISVAIERVGRSSVTIILHAMKDGRERVRGRYVSVCTAIDTWRVVPLPPDLKDALLAYQGAADTRIDQA